MARGNKRKWPSDMMRLTELEYFLFRKLRETHALCRFYQEADGCLVVDLAPWSDADNRVAYRFAAVTMLHVHRFDEASTWPWDIINIKAYPMLDQQGRHRYEFDCFEIKFTFNAQWPVEITDRATLATDALPIPGVVASEPKPILPTNFLREP